MEATPDIFTSGSTSAGTISLESTWSAPVLAPPRRTAVPPRRAAVVAAPRLGGEIVHNVGLWLDAGRTIVAAEGNRRQAYLVAKRAMDIVGAAAAIIAFSPIILTVLCILMVTTKGRPFFVQERIGFRGRKFPMLKFRTMRLDAEQLKDQIKNEKDGPIFKNRRDPRITRVGAILRRTSIDEMPQLWNVLVGHMALVGPRPPVEKEVRQYQPWQRRRLAVQPGLTCLWQVSGRSEIGFEDWVRMDLWYVKNQSIKTDLWLLVKTPLSVLSCRGAY